VALVRAFFYLPLEVEMQRTMRFILEIVLILTVTGLVMLASASGTRAADSVLTQGDSFYYVKRQLIWLLLAGAAGGCAAFMPMQWLRRLAVPGWLFTLVLLVLVRIPGIGQNINGSYRWLSFAGLTFQPSELAKLSVILLLAWWYSARLRRTAEFKRGFLIPAAALGMTVVLILVAPDFGTTMLIALVGLMIMLCAGAHLGYILVSALAGICAMSVLIMNNEVRRRRITAFLDVNRYLDSDSWQLGNSLHAFKNGGLTGVGLGESMQKHYYLPEAHTDFIYAILGEELGMIGSGLVLALFGALLICGVVLALRIKKPFERLLVFGITFMFSVQALINLGVVTGCLPTKGLPLPFISYGGSSMLISGIMIGLLVAAVRSAETDAMPT